MNKLAVILGALLCLGGPARAGVELVGGPPRSCGDRTVTRTFRLDHQGAADVEWETAILAGIIQRGVLKDVPPGEVKIELKLPSVRARVELRQEVRIRQGGKVVASGTFPMELFPAGLAAPAETPAPVLGAIDDSGALAAFLEKSGWRVARITANLQYREAGSKVVLIAAGQGEALGEPMSGLDDFMESGGRVICLEQSEERKNLFDPERRWKPAPGGAPSADPVVKSNHPMLLDLKPGDLANWAGSGRVAARAARWDDWPWRRDWLAAGGPDAAPLLTEYWHGPTTGAGTFSKGRIIRSQLDIGARLESEPAAQILLRNLICYAMASPAPAPARVRRFALRPDGIRDGRIRTLIADPKPEDIKEALALIAVLSPDAADEATPPDLEQFLRAGGTVLIQSPFGDEMVGAVNRLIADMTPRDARTAPPAMTAVSLPAPPQCKVDYAHPIAWGIPAATLDAALSDAKELHFLVLEADTKSFAPLAQPPVLSMLTLGKARIVLCALPVDDPENENRNRIVTQLLANLAEPPNKTEGTSVK